MNRWMTVVASALVLGGACVTPNDLCRQSYQECHLRYSRDYGYYRECNFAASSCAYKNGQTSQGGTSAQGDDSSAAMSPSDLSDEDLADGEGPDAGAPVASSTEEGAAQGGERYSAFDFACVRDSQCGPGKCLEGKCYYGCSSDAQCGTGDRCAAEGGTRICLPDPNPPVRCTRSAQCEASDVCLNGTCHQLCSASNQCNNLLDRCLNGVCEPDRRPLGECVLDSECAEGLVCLDGACVDWCTAHPPADGKMCEAPSTTPPADTTPPVDTTPPPDVDEPGPQVGPDAGAPPPLPTIY